MGQSRVRGRSPGRMDSRIVDAFHPALERLERAVLDGLSGGGDHGQEIAQVLDGVQAVGQDLPRLIVADRKSVV